MERGLQKVNQRSRLVERGRQAEACRNSGQRVSEWCGEHGIPVSTYYSWQRKVFQAAVSENVDLQVNIHAGADAETIQMIVRALKSC